MHTLIVASAYNTLLAMNRIMSLLRGRDFRVEALSIARSERPDVARLTVVVDAAATRPDRVASCLDRLDEVWSVARVDPHDVLCWEVALVKVVEGLVPHAIADSPDASGTARAIERNADAVIYELTGSPALVDALIGSLPPGSILEVARLGPMVMTRGRQRTTTVMPPA